MELTAGNSTQNCPGPAVTVDQIASARRKLSRRAMNTPVSGVENRVRCRSQPSGRIATEAAPLDPVGMDEDHMGDPAPLPHEPRAWPQGDRRRGCNRAAA
jgi:hypothetical protein